MVDVEAVIVEVNVTPLVTVTVVIGSQDEHQEQADGQLLRALTPAA